MIVLIILLNKPGFNKTAVLYFKIGLPKFYFLFTQIICNDSSNFKYEHDVHCPFYY